MSGFCKDCKHWDQSDFDLRYIGACVRTVSEREQRQDLDSRAWVDVDSDERAVLVTTDEFGCVQFSRRLEVS